MLRGINRLQIPKNRFYITKSPMEITYKKYNTTIYFSGSDGIDDTKGIIDEDKPIKLVVLDELTEFFDDGEGEDELANIEATFVRGNKAGFQMIYLYNPPKNPNAPVNLWCKKMEKRPDCIHIHTDYRDVPVDWLGQDLINSAEAMKAVDPKMYRWTWLASFYRQQGLSEEQITTAIADFKAKQKAQQPDVDTITRERDAAQKELQELKNEKILTGKGVKADDLDYVMFKVSKLVDDKTDFTKAAEKFLKENPKYTGAGTYRVSTSTGSDNQDTGGSVNMNINDRIRAAARR